MVKIDFNRDYYGDLGVSPSATDAEIKKQFRKLALQYHPDRNRGNEEDSNEKFQIIGAAHEILSDPTQRAKYNAGRAQYTSGFPRASGVRGNPWANAGSQFQPPPRRTNAKPSGSGVPPPHPTGTGRFSNFASAVPPTAKQGSSSASSDGLKSAYAAWQNMRNEKSNSSPHKQPPSPSKNASYAPPPPPRPSAAQPVRRPVPKTPTQKARAESSFGTARRAGFHPRSDGDEPPVSSSNYSTSNRRRMEDLYANAGDDENDLDDYKPEKPPRPRVSTQHSIPRAEAFADTTSDESSSGGESPTKVPNAARPKIPMPRRRAAAPKRTHDQASTDASRKSPHDDEFDTGTSTAGFSTSAGATTPISGIDSPNAMDIDSPPSCGQATRTPKVPPLPPKIPQASHARNVPVEPAKKEWRSGDLGGGPAIPQDFPQRRPVDGGFRGSEDSPEFYDSLNDLRNVEPFISQPGLHSMGDLKMNLPFESKPEPTPLKAPTYGNAKVQSLDFPQVPIAPVLPMASYTGAPLGANELQGYKIKFQQYLRDWEIFNRRIVSHFERRQAELEAVRASLGAADLLGDAKLRDQLEWARQDREVRSRWSMAWEEHEIQVQQYLEVKSRAK
ncbi:DnAJ-like protein [Ceratocystis platani]|uniref:DnAJ-like protein n=1 Tax=Ceratocystis fimbriata f. sp. platani TaxID=88771 RepID=A0A0F8CTL8_CERFI|nr:DnAJ-like protein [Ceratocystis platani]